MINLEDMKKQLNDQLEQEARESGRLSAEDIKKPEPIQAEKLPEESGEDVKTYEPKHAGTDQKRIEKKRDSIDSSEPDQIDINKILAEAPEDEKGNKIIPDDIFDQYIKELPAGTKNQSGTWRAANKGKIKIFGGNPEADKQIHRAGANASNAAQAQRRSLAEDLKIALSKKATRATLAELDLQDGATNQDAITAAAIIQASAGNVKALQYIRDTIGEQPTAKQDVNVSMSDADKALLDKVQARLGIDQE